MSLIAAKVLSCVLAGVLAQETAQGAMAPGKNGRDALATASPPVEWREGLTIPVRIPLSSPGHEFMTTLSLPEESIETAITGWGEGELTAIPKRGLLFLRL